MLQLLLLMNFFPFTSEKHSNRDQIEPVAGSSGKFFKIHEIGSKYFLNRMITTGHIFHPCNHI